MTMHWFKNSLTYIREDKRVWAQLDDLVKYNVGRDDAGPVDITKKDQASTVLSDWNRYARQNETLLINGQKFADLLPVLAKEKKNFDTNFEALSTDDQKKTRFAYDVFKSIDDLRTFVREQLFPDIINNDDPVITQALNNLNQGGLFGTTAKAMSLSMADPSLSRALGEPEPKKIQILLNRSPEGLLVTERNTYDKMKEKQTGRTVENQSHHPWVETESHYRLKSDGHVDILDVAIKCQSQAVRDSILPPEPESANENRPS